MSREAKSESTSQRKASDDHAPDLDAEHDPDQSRRASLASLRRGLPDNKPAGAPSGTEHDKAQAAGDEGVDQLLALAATRVDHAATDIVQALGTMTVAGPSKQRMVCDTNFAEVLDLVRGLEHVIGASGPVGLRPGIRRLNGAWARFEAAWNTAEQHFPAGELKQTSHELRTSVVHLNKLVGLDYEASGSSDSSQDTRKPDAILANAIQANLEAVQRAAHAVRQGAVGGEDAAVAADLRTLVVHTDELAATLRSTLAPNASAQQLDKAGLRKAVAETHAAQQALAGKPALAHELASNTTFKYSLATLEDLSEVKAASWKHREQIHDIKARIVGKHVFEESFLTITIGSGSNQGITNGMTGYLADERGVRAHRAPSFQVSGVSHQLCEATLKTEPDDAYHHPYVVLHPSKG